MALKEDLAKRVKNEESQALLLSYARTYRLKTVSEIKAKLDYHIDKCDQFLATNRMYATINRRRRDYVHKLKYFTQLKKIVERI